MHASRPEPSSSTSVASFRSLGKDCAQKGIVTISVLMMDSHMSLEVVGPGIFVLLVWTKRTHIAGRSVNEAVSAERCVSHGGCMGMCSSNLTESSRSSF